MFERVEIGVRAGGGGSGAISFRREKFVPLGGPDGGDGGKGGNVIVLADRAVTALGDFTPRRVYRAGNGRNGGGQRKHGKNGVDLVLKVPPGTVVTDAEQRVMIADLDQDGQSVLLARGGKGGWGNSHYASSINQAPRIAQKGEESEERSIILELRLIADVGIIGYPNVGKSTLLAAASAAKPKIADYPFTTTEPVLGVVTVGGKCFVMAEIPGLIEGAHLGRGLGHEFLRHALRTRVLIHLVDGASATPVEDMIRVNNELALYDAELARKPQIVAVNKVDLAEVKARMSEIKESFREAGVSATFISAATGEEISKLAGRAMEMLGSVTVAKKEAVGVPEKIFRPRPKRTSLSVRKEGETFVVSATEMERLVAGTDISSYEGRHQLQRELSKRGLKQALARAGGKPGDKIRCGNLEWEL